MKCFEIENSFEFCVLVEDGIADGLQNWFKLFINLYVDLAEPRKTSSTTSSKEDFQQIEKDLREQRLNTIYTVTFYIDSFFSMASAIIELQKLTRYLRVEIVFFFCSAKISSMNFCV